ncbi:L,D-transpeptidase family protein [Chachezhania antarctica]|mgnify:CR=1 FL=1|uniref:L,D-transpeptidase family protein n=1 Tax=Chachezhania antarctica TaxID=2340860 RepID=UPI000EB27B78|nr:L,D-transpeptidase family protein [Chachezhania antarctica]
MTAIRSTGKTALSAKHWLGGILLGGLIAVSSAQAQVTAFKQGVAESAIGRDSVATLYRQRDYAPLWTADDAAGQARRAFLLEAMRSVDVHGIPASRYDPDALIAQMSAAETPRQLGALEIAMSDAFLKYARDVQSGILTPRKIDSQIVREVQYTDKGALLDSISGDTAEEVRAGFMTLPPQSNEYRALMKQRLLLEETMASGRWGATVPSGRLELGDSGPNVVRLRDRLVRMGYLDPSPARDFDRALENAVQEFQLTHGLEADGVAGPETIEEINVPADKRLQSVLVAMERERWLNQDLGARHVKVNITDYSARIMQDGDIAFETRSVVGANRSGRRTPEFSDVMEHMVINPSWYVPRSIIRNEYLPKLRQNRHAVGHLEITDSRGRVVNRGSVNFANYSGKNFPFSMRQPPSKSNALGLVKFMFPNQYNIYLHDTPQKHLFDRTTRAFSHGCIRLAEPFEFAYELLSVQTESPEDDFHRVLDTGAETRVTLDTPVPVHLIYRTAFTDAQGRLEFRPDVYGRDARIWEALSNAGVALNPVQS